MFIRFLTKFPNDVQIRILYSYFTFEFLKKINVSKLNILTAFNSSPSFSQSFSLFRLLKFIHEDYLNLDDDIFTVEEHSVTGGLGSLICEVACDTVPKKIHRIGMRGFGQSADWKTLLHNYKLDGEGVASQVLEVLNNK